MSLILIGFACLLIVLIFWDTKDQKTATNDDHQETENSIGELNSENMIDINGNKDVDKSNSANNRGENESEDTSNIDETNENSLIVEENGETSIEEHKDAAEENEEDDENVIDRYIKDWEPVGTVQEEPHEVNYAKDSIDREEMALAVALATGLKEEDTITWWVGNNGVQKVKVTVSDRMQEEFYRVYLSWIEEEGWMPTLVEILKENDIEL